MLTQSTNFMHTGSTKAEKNLLTVAYKTNSVTAYWFYPTLHNTNCTLSNVEWIAHTEH